MITISHFTHLSSSNDPINSRPDHTTIMLEVDVVEHVCRGKEHGCGVGKVLTHRLTEGVTRTLAKHERFLICEVLIINQFNSPFGSTHIS